MSLTDERLGDLPLPDRPRLVVGDGAIAQVGPLADELGAKRALIVTDPGIAGAGHVQLAVASLESVGAAVTVFDETIENPTTIEVNKAVEAARRADADLLVGLGGGSSMDTAKGCNFVLTGGGEMKDYWGVGKATQPMLPLIAVPTTAGTGSECQSFALISDPDTHVKMACGDKKALAFAAVLDAERTLTQPRRVAADTGIDAISHIVETAVTTKRTGLSWALTRRAWQLGATALARVLENGDDLAARRDIQLAAALAGTAIEHSMLGVAHACANPLTANFNVVHGRAVGVMLPAVVRFNGELPECRAAYAALVGGDEADAHERLAMQLEALLNHAAVPRSLDAHGVSAGDLDRLAEQAAEQWTGTFNPRPVDPAACRALYESILVENAETAPGTGRGRPV